jgi:prefoldin beta subunit
MSENTNMINTYRQQLMFLSQQKQQLQLQANILENTLKELDITKETKVYKGIGNVFILSDKEDVIKQTKENKETIDLRFKTVEKQEADILKKLNDLSKDSTKDDSDKKNEGNPEGIA